MRTDDKVNELLKRQVYYGSSMAVKLNKVDGEFFYTVYAWYSLENKVDNKFVVLMNKYNGEDPDDLIALALKELNLRKIKLGVPQRC